MAYAATVLDEFRLSYEKSNLDAHDNRFSDYGAYATFVKDTPNLIPGYAELIAGRASAARTASIPVLTRQTLSTAAVRSCTPTYNQATSAYVTPSWTTVEAGFMMVPAEHQDNYIKYQDAFNHQGRAVEKAFLLDADTDAVAYLVAHLTYADAAKGNPFFQTAYYMQVPLAFHDTFFQDLKDVMYANDITGDINIVGSHRVRGLVEYYSNQGAGNSANLTFQYNGFNFAYSNRTAIGTALLGVAYAMPVGSLGYLNWVDIDAKMGNKSGDGKEWYEQELPLLGQKVGVLFQSSCADKSGLLTGLEASLMENYSFSFDRAFTSSYDATITTDAGVIFGIEFAKT
jgi:hypothetical protein